MLGIIFVVEHPEELTWVLWKIVTNPLKISQKKLVRAFFGAYRMDSARKSFNSLKIFNINYVSSCIVCSYIHKSISRIDDIFVRYESQYKTPHTLNQALHASILTQLKLCNILHTLIPEYLILMHCFRESNSQKVNWKLILCKKILENR